MSAPALKTTALNASHRERGARMVDFGGWDMPLHYGSQIEEHHRVRRACGMFDVSHMLAIDVRGAGSRAFLAYVLANNVGRLRQPGHALYSCLLNPAGGVIDDLIVYFFAEDWFRLVVNAGTAGQGLRVVDRAARRARARGNADRAARSRDHCRAGAAGARQGPRRVARRRRPPARTSSISAPRTSARPCSRAPAIPARTALKSCCLHAQAAALWRQLERAGRGGGGSRRARHVAPGGRHESLRPGHG